MSYYIIIYLPIIKYPFQILLFRVHLNRLEKAPYYSYITIDAYEYFPPAKYYPIILIYSQ